MYGILRSKNYSLIIPFLVKILIPDREKRQVYVDMLPFRKYTILLPHLTNIIILGQNLKRQEGKGNNNGGEEGWMSYFIYL